MSFILDALRKSESERQQQTGPGLADVQYRSLSTRKNLWIPLLVIVLAINAVILAWVMNSDSSDSDEGTRVTGQRNAPTLSESSEIRPLSREIVENRFAATIEEPKQTPIDASNQPLSVVQQFTADPSTSAGAAEAGTVRDGLPSLQQLTLAGDISVQPMHLDIHVFSKVRAERFIFINMKKYKEGDNLAEGPAVDEITSTGAILSYRGKQFTLDRD